jgi:hypothetical protein
MDKKATSVLRNQYLTLTHRHDIITVEEITDLEYNYGKYCYLPFDIPRFEDSNMIDWFFEKCKAVKKQKTDIADSSVGISLFNSINVYFDESIRNNSTIWTTNEVRDFKKTFPHFYQQLHDLLPLKTIPRINFWQSTGVIEPHRDHVTCVDMPNSIRIMLYDENPTSTLYIREDRENYQSKKYYIPQISDTNTFAWNNLRVVHGSDYDNKYRKILILFNDFVVDYKKYKTLIDRSVVKYSDNVAISTADIADFCYL